MPWNAQWPNGTLSVKDNRVPGAENTTYIEETLGNQAIGTNPPVQTAQDHFWNLDGYEGHHRFVQMPSFIDNAASPTDPILWLLMDGALYMKEKNSTESPAVQKSEPFLKSDKGTGTDDQILQLGFRAICNFTGSAANPIQSAFNYTHNIKPYNANPALSGIQRNSIGKYTIRFATPLPSINYGVQITAMRGIGGNVSPLICGILEGTDRTVSMSKDFVKIVINDEDNAPKDPLYLCLNIIGG